MWGAIFYSLMKDVTELQFLLLMFIIALSSKPYELNKTIASNYLTSDESHSDKLK